MTALITPADFRDHFETDLSDAALQAIIDANQEDVDRYTGGHEQATIIQWGNDRYIIDGRLRGAVINSITEKVYDVSTVLASNDYTLNGAILERINTGTNPRTYWGGPVYITYTPGNNARAKLALIDLCKISCQFNGVAQESNGSYSYNQPDAESQRKKVLARLTTGLGLV